MSRPLDIQPTGRAALRLLIMVALLATIALPRPIQASSDFYLLYRHWQPYDWPDDGPSANEVTRSQRGLGWRRLVRAGDFGFDYDYQPFRIRTGEPAHNGHLHRLTFGGQWSHRLYRVEARAGLAGTSNMFKYQDFHSDALTGRIALFRAVSEDSPLSLGFGGDHRFGSFHWLPRVRWEHAGDNGNWLVDLPVLFQWQSPGKRWAFRFGRDGDRWATLDQAREVEGALYLREWRTELTYRVTSGDAVWPSLVVGIGASLDTRVQYQDLEEGTVDHRLGDTLLGSIRVGW